LGDLAIIFVSKSCNDRSTKFATSKTNVFTVAEGIVSLVT